MLGIALSLLGALGLAGTVVLSRRGMPGVHPLLTNVVIVLVGIPVAAVLVLAFAFPDIGEIPRAVLPWIVLLGTVQLAVGRSTGFFAVNMIGASRTSLFFGVQAPFAALLAVTLGGESLSILVAVGTAVLVVGLLLASGDSMLQGWRADRRYLVGCVLAVATGASAGAANVIAKTAIGVFDSPLLIACLGMVAGLIVLLLIACLGMVAGLIVLSPPVGVAAVLDRSIRTVDRKSLVFVSLAGLTSVAAFAAPVFAVQQVDVVVVAPLYSTFPLWTLLLSHMFIGRLENVTLRLTVGATLAVAGVVAVSLGGSL